MLEHPSSAHHEGATRAVQPHTHRGAPPPNARELIMPPQHRRASFGKELSVVKTDLTTVQGKTVTVATVVQAHHTATMSAIAAARVDDRNGRSSSPFDSVCSFRILLVLATSFFRVLPLLARARALKVF